MASGAASKGTPTGDEWRQRRDDHLVEPMFAGLGAERGEHGERRPPRDDRSGRWARLLLALVVLAVLAGLAMAWW